ncbi:hypothetical protein BT93_L3383 [Corymbia citriodora subsp. variegata]|uniref:Uncharacterized protein n=1 Tax=Corymbia citriodora subsp. variegata TaxID=360336 RepID=A0A8T0CHA9_CORYI|nr:hypothetical protein BT93_L3383 [Corymbia citriodora subsp. variegata]
MTRLPLPQGDALSSSLGFGSLALIGQLAKRPRPPAKVEPKSGAFWSSENPLSPLSFSLLKQGFMQGLAATPQSHLLPPQNRSNGVPSRPKLGHPPPKIQFCARRTSPRPPPMLKLLSSSACLQTRARHAAASRPLSLGCPRAGTEPSNPLLRALSSLRGLGRRSPNSVQRAFFCSDSTGDDGAAAAQAEGKAADSESETAEKPVSAIIPTNPRLDDYLTVGLSPRILCGIDASFGL